MERKTYVRNLIVGALGGATLGALLVLAYRKWGRRLDVQRRTGKAKAVVRQPVSIRQAAQVGMLGFQLLRELAQLLQPDESA